MDSITAIIFLVLLLVALVLIVFCLFVVNIYFQRIADVLEKMFNTQLLVAQEERDNFIEVSDTRIFLKGFLENVFKAMFPIKPDKEKKKSIFTKKEVIKK